MVSILHKRIYRHLSRVLLLAIVICVSFPALAVFTGTGTISNPNPSPGELVSVNWVLTESDDTGGTFPVHSPSEISIFEPIFPLGTQPPVSIIGSIIPPGIVGDLGPIPPGPNFLTHNEVNILIPPGIAPGSYLLNRDWEGPGGNVAGGVSAAFTIGAGDPATPPELEPVVVDVSGTAIPDSVDQGSIHTVQIEWSFNLTTNLAQNIASNSGLLDDEIVNGPLNSFNYLSGQRLTESLLITREQIDQAITNDESQLVYMREFTVNNEITVVGSVLIDIDGGLLSTVSASSASSTLQVDRSHTIFVNWLATLQRVGLGTSRNITSNRGEFLLPDGTRLGAGVANSLSQSTVSTALFNESVTIGRSVLLQGVQANANQIIYRREFTDGIVTVEAMVTFQLVASGSSGELFIPYLGLSFADGSVQKVVRSGEAPTAIAEITTQGIGSLEGYWEVAVPPSTLGQPIFTPVKFVQSQLAGSTIHRETSPVLPIASEGLYLVRFRLTRPQINQDMPQILYVVKGGNAPKPITILDPKPGVPVTHKTVFQWQGIPSSVAYKLEIFAWPRSSVDQLVFPGENVCRELDRSELSDRPIAGIFVRATETAASLGDLVLEQLQNSTIDRRIFCYHVAAIDGSGRRIGLSALETIVLIGNDAPAAVVAPEPTKSPIAITTKPLQGTGLGKQPITITTKPLQGTGLGKQPITITTNPLQGTGLGKQPITITTKPLQGTGLGKQPITITAKPLQGTGLGKQSITITTKPLQGTGLGKQPITITTKPLQGTGLGKQPISITTKSLQGTGLGKTPITRDTGNVVFTKSDQTNSNEPISLISLDPDDDDNPSAKNSVFINLKTLSIASDGLKQATNPDINSTIINLRTLSIGSGRSAVGGN